MYTKLDELPICNCGCNSKYHVDLDHLDQYSDALLYEMLHEIERVTMNFASILSSPSPLCDIEAMENYHLHEIQQRFYEPYTKIREELEKRTNPQTMDEFVYALGKFFEKMGHEQKD